MTIKVAINGYGRIGRNIMRAIHEYGRTDEFNIVAINDPTAFQPLDELVFARRDGFLRALLARRNDRQLGACGARWAADHPDQVAAYDAWRAARFAAPDDEEAEAGEEPPPEDPGEGDGSP